MSQESEFPFERARRVTPVEKQEFKAAISEQFGIDLKKRGIGYQTVINEVLLAQIG
jgi:uncharacterized protein (DUF4415 family)